MTTGRTTIRLDQELLKEAKHTATASGRTLTQVIEDALRESFARKRSASQKRERITLPTFKGNGIRPGLDLYDSASLTEFMDKYDADS
jgi:hypothetical protein